MDVDKEPLRLNSRYFFPDRRSLKLMYGDIVVDLDSFYRKFMEAGDTKFASFAAIWVEKKYPTIFTKRRTPADLLEFTDGLIHYAKSYLFSPQLTASLFGLYFIFSVCIKQINRFMYSKLRLNHSEFEELRCILDNMYKTGHIETQAIYKILHDSGCIAYVASPLEAGIEEGFKKYFPGSEEETAPRIPTQTKFVDTPILKNLETLNTLYTDMKNEIYENQDHFVCDSDFVVMINNQLRLLRIGSEPAEKKETDDYTPGEKRRSLKARSFSQMKKESQPETNAVDIAQCSTMVRGKGNVFRKMMLVEEKVEKMEVQREPEPESALPSLE